MVRLYLLRVIQWSGYGQEALPGLAGWRFGLWHDRVGISKNLYSSLLFSTLLYFSLPSPSRRALPLGLCPGMAAGRHPAVQPQMGSHAPVLADLKTVSMTDMFPIESSRDTACSTSPRIASENRSPCIVY